jgi:Novel STAND NTPase 3
MRFLTNKNIEQGVTAKYDRKNRFVIKKYKAKAGFYIYLLSNSSNNDRLAIPHFLMDRFRAFLTDLSDSLMGATADTIEIDQRLYFKDIDFYRFQYSANTLDCLAIVDLKNASRFNIYREAVHTVLTLLYNPKLDHPNGIFDRIIDYHKLFQFTFNEGSESITSGLSVRRNTLIEIDDYVPLEKNNSRDHIISITTDLAQLDESLKNIGSASKKKSAQQNTEFKRKLGERSSEQNYTIDYDLLFGGGKNAEAQTLADTRSGFKPVTTSSCPVPLLAGSVKAHDSRVYKCELTPEDASALRAGVLADRDGEHLLGFEIFTAVYKSGRKLKSFSFPLYYMNVKLEESGRFLHVYPPENGDVYLNHLSLSVFIEKFTKSKKNDPLEAFFNTLLSQKIEIEKKLQDITIHRQLPYSEDVFRQTREILIGHRGENGKGGIIERLDILGIECDLDSVILYRADRHPSSLTRALDQDLKRIQKTAHEYPNKFYSSLLGKFLNPELKVKSTDAEPFFPIALSPGTPTRSSKLLMRNLNEHDLVLLEGPPGTGKTFTIRNLLIHCINSGKRLLIVSDQMAAIHALTEKVQDYLVASDIGSPDAISKLNLWKSAVKVIDDIPPNTGDLSVWVNKLSTMLMMDLSREQDWPVDKPDLLARIEQLDLEAASIKRNIGTSAQNSYDARVNKQANQMFEEAHCSTEDVSDLTAFLTFVGSGSHSKLKKPSVYIKNQALITQFVEMRLIMLKSQYCECYPEFELKNHDIGTLESDVSAHIGILQLLIREKPKSKAVLDDLFQVEAESNIYFFLDRFWDDTFEAIAKGSLLTKIKAFFIHPCLAVWQAVLQQLEFHQSFLSTIKDCDNALTLLSQFDQIHRYLDPNCTEVEHCLAYDICKHVAVGYREASINFQLELLAKIQKERDRLVKELCFLSLAKISKGTIANRELGTNRATSIINILESLKSCSSIDSGSAVAILKELQEALWESFPIWICRKQAVPFLFPSKENMIDLVIVDEAGQCRVDDALPLLYRAKKLMVVGDDKQTVIDKNSIIDDYLFRESQLEEHLRNIQARGVKGGGSNLFELVKSIKQGGVLLDEHYRCPPAIIAYSNQYVYNSELTVMQWQLPNTPPSVVVDYGEKFATSNIKATSGKYKGIETEMADRFMSYVAKTIKRIERETKRKINLETDVAICYFLLKNESFVKDHKPALMNKLGRAGDVLDGAGAALQGKERDYIFYYWDINTSNFSSFKQGDDPDKRKGEMNVLMSRPKVRAYHYLHGGFQSLKHESASITDYLWKTYHSQNKKRTKVRSDLPSNPVASQSGALNRSSSGQSMYVMLSFLWECRGVNVEAAYDLHFNVVIGNPKQKVDLMLVPRDNLEAKSIAVVDIGAFATSHSPSEDLIEYYFQLQRAVPSVDPVFAYVHELSDERSSAYQRIEQKILEKT